MLPKIGFVGAGKLGAPVAAAMAYRGAYVIANDINPARMDISTYREEEHGYGQSYRELLHAVTASGHLKFGTQAEVIDNSDIIFLAPQTPHAPHLDGTQPFDPSHASDFSYDQLEKCLKGVLDHIHKQQSYGFNDRTLPKVVVIISTVLPGTLDRLLSNYQFAGKWVEIVYNPFFIAMGTVIADFLHPEFILLGTRPGWKEGLEHLKQFYTDLLKPVPQFAEMSIPSAELTKIGYNLCITLKLSAINTLMHAAHTIPGADIDDVSKALRLATTRICGPAYMLGGMGDGGSCHPRDTLAMSWFAKSHKLHYDIFGAAMQERQRHAQWMAGLIWSEIRSRDDWRSFKVGVLGTAYKPQVNLTAGSHTLLMLNFFYLDAPKDYKIETYDPYVEGDPHPTTPLHIDWDIVFIGCNHGVFSSYTFKEGCTIIDPYRMFPKHWDEKYNIIRLGVGKEER